MHGMGEPLGSPTRTAGSVRVSRIRCLIALASYSYFTGCHALLSLGPKLALAVLIHLGTSYSIFKAQFSHLFLGKASFLGILFCEVVVTTVREESGECWDLVFLVVQLWGFSECCCSPFCSLATFFNAVNLTTHSQIDNSPHCAKHLDNNPGFQTKPSAI